MKSALNVACSKQNKKNFLNQSEDCKLVIYLFRSTFIFVLNNAIALKYENASIRNKICKEGILCRLQLWDFTNEPNIIWYFCFMNNKDSRAVSTSKPPSLLSLSRYSTMLHALSCTRKKRDGKKTFTSVIKVSIRKQKSC